MKNAAYDPLDITTELMARCVSAALKRCARNASNLDAWKSRAAEACGIPFKTFEGFWHGDNPPGAKNMARMMRHFGAAFATDAWAPTGVAGIDAGDAETIAQGEALKAIRLLRPMIAGVLDDMDAVIAMAPGREEGE